MAWRYLRGDGSVIAPLIRCLPSLVVGGYISEMERSWDLRDGTLVFMNLDGVATVVFDQATNKEERPVRLVGHLAANPDASRVLESIDMPSGLNFGQISQQTQAVLLRQPPASQPRRRNLVVLRANEQSIHRSWEQNLDERDRNWDLCISWYGQGSPDDVADCEFLSIQREDRKFGAIHALFQPESPLWAYDQIWLPDDDLQIARRDINRLFMTCQRHGLHLAQPSLVPTSFVNHKMTAQQPDYALRYTNFVEVMCPLFSNMALRLCLPSFNASMSGFGLDHIWPRLLGMVHSHMAIIDDVAVAHTRPMGNSYDMASAINEDRNLRRLYGEGVPISTVGGLHKREILI